MHNLELKQKEIHIVIGGACCACAIPPNVIIDIEDGAASNERCVQLCCAHNGAIKAFFTSANINAPGYNPENDKKIVKTECRTPYASVFKSLPSNIHSGSDFK